LSLPDYNKHSGNWGGHPSFRDNGGQMFLNSVDSQDLIDWFDNEGLECNVGEVCKYISGHVKDNHHVTMDWGAHPMRYDTDTLIFGGNNGGWFKMVATNLEGTMKETRYVKREVVQSRIHGLTPAIWDSVKSTKLTEVNGKKTCVEGEFLEVEILQYRSFQW
jgi:hypothetical protein